MTRPFLSPGAESVTPCSSASAVTCSTCCQWQVQAEVILGETPGAAISSTKETVTFNDAVLGEVSGLDIKTSEVSSIDQTENIDFVKFLSRPVKIGTFTWQETDAIGTSHTFNPWNLYFTDPRVKYKLNNFAFIQCKLKIKVLINASPFYYGRMYMGYQPLPTLTPSTITNDTGTRYLIPYSQRPHIWIEPMDNAGGEMTLPFFYQQNWINAQSAQNMTDQGKLTFLNYTTLQSANGISGTGVTIAIYAWAEDVKLSGPSAGLATQSWVVQSDEYGQGFVSGPASAVSKAASYLEGIPFIGRFATATRMGASAVSSIASLFGWTNVPVIADTMPFRPEPFPQLATTQIGYPFQKLTLDPKNELSIDPTLTGLTNEDELVITSLCKKPSYLTTATWTTANLVDDLLFSSRVNPRQYDNDGATQSKLYMTPMCWVSSLFNDWRGDMIFKFKVVASQFHKGRLRISFDPSGYATENIISDPATSNVVFTSIIDLGDKNEVEFVVPYQQAISYLVNRASGLSTANINWSTSLTPSFTYSPSYDNGTITLRVLTTLTAPVASSSVSILVFVRAGENLELANPIDLPAYSTWAVQSDVQHVNRMETLGTMQDKRCGEQNLINFGETVKSLRQLLRRMSLVSVSTPAAATADMDVWSKYFTKIPGAYGFDTNGINLAKGLVVPAANFQFNYSQPLPLTWILPAFVAYRGSTHWTFNVTSGANPVEHLRVIRMNTQGGGAYETSTASAYGTTSANAAFFYNASYAGASGQALTNQRTNTGLSVTAPMYTAYRFQSTAPSNYTLPGYSDGQGLDLFKLEAVFSTSGGAPAPTGSKIWAYNSIGTDFGCHFFLNVPTFWIYSAVPTPD